MKKPFLIYLLSTIAATTIAAQTGMPAPRLVVGITVDQLRSDYLEKFSSFYSEDGLKRLLRDGVIYSHGQYSSRDIDRASAVASIYTGTVPYQHGIIGSEWMDRKVLQLVHPTCEHLLVSTIGDELKIATDGRAYVYGVGTKTMRLSSLPGMQPMVLCGEARAEVAPFRLSREANHHSSVRSRHTMPIPTNGWLRWLPNSSTAQNWARTKCQTCLLSTSLQALKATLLRKAYVRWNFRTPTCVLTTL